jgi:hypothetical protein
MAKKGIYPYKDYPVLGYRVTKAIYEDLVAHLEAVLNIWNKDVPDHEKPYKKNDIFVKALKRGLSQLESEKKKK